MSAVYGEVKYRLRKIFGTLETHMIANPATSIVFAMAVVMVLRFSQVPLLLGRNQPPKAVPEEKFKPMLEIASTTVTTRKSRERPHRHEESLEWIQAPRRRAGRAV